MPENFTLHPRLEADTITIGRFPETLVLLHRDARYPWVILVPTLPGIREIHELPHEVRHRLLDESCGVAAAMQALLGATKMNVAALGNMVPQLHLHHVARFEGDDAWPGAIWGAHPGLEYTAEALEARRGELRGAFAALPGFG
ncbi:MAG: HIT family protein [Sandaracinus sp.]|nr:HIT family protein [Sandaracinus sp.]|tara:strand:+ start:5343 stop:5771 length:429 start_codon:yes stop_codon:yes gene_type:complete